MTKTDAERVMGVAVDAAQIASRAAKKAKAARDRAETLVPDPHREMLRAVASQEQRVRRASRPATRRWRGLEKRDEKIDALSLRLSEAVNRLHEAEEILKRAPDDDARALAAWIAAGEKGERPAPTVYERQRDRDAARILVDALQVERDEALAERVRYVERHRAKMLKEALRDVVVARDRLLEHVRGLGGLREELLVARDNLTWVTNYPEAPESYGFPTALALGLRAPVERTLQTSARVEFGNVVAALEEDANALADAHAKATKEKLGTAPAPTPLDRAMWDSDPAMVEWKRQERERARRLAEQGHDINKLAAEVRE
jgi:hypothetical protein